MTSPLARSRAWARETLLIALDVLPWPWGEEILAALFMAVGLLRPYRRRAALDWARARGTAHPLRLAAALCAFLGRWVARYHLLGIRGPDELRRLLVVEGEERLRAVSGGVILLGFHLGPPSRDVIFRVLGYPLTYLGWSDPTANIAWRRDAWRPFAEPPPLSRANGDPANWPAVLYRAQQRLLDGGTVHIRAEGKGREAFRLRLSVGELSIGGGALTLHRLTGAPVLPVLHHLDGRRQVMTIHEPLPALGPDPAADLDGWRDRLTTHLEDYIRRFPDQCPFLALDERTAVKRRIAGVRGA